MFGCGTRTMASLMVSHCPAILAPFLGLPRSPSPVVQVLLSRVDPTGSCSCGISLWVGPSAGLS